MAQRWRWIGPWYRWTKEGPWVIWLRWYEVDGDLWEVHAYQAEFWEWEVVAAVAVGGG